MIKVLHILQQSLPEHQTGYDIRSHYILKTQRDLGIDARALTGPYSLAKDRKNIIDGVTYYHMSRISRSFFLAISKRSFVKDREISRILFEKIFDASLTKIIDEFKPDIIHAHTPWFTALPALNRVKKEGIPFVYEVRGLWEESEVAEGIITDADKAYHTYREKDDHIIETANAVIVISERLKDEIIRRGAVPSKIFVVPNGVDVKKFNPIPPDARLIQKFGLNGKTVIGYISSLRKLEGIEYLLDAMTYVDEQGVAMVVGNGPEKENLKRKADTLGISNRVHFIDKVSHIDITRYYSIIDIFVVPRVNAKVSQLVTPLKPLEAMAMGKCVLASDVGGLSELVEDGRTGMLFRPEDTADLSRKINDLISNPEQRTLLGRNASEFVKQKLTWEKVCRHYLDIYNQI